MAMTPTEDLILEVLIARHRLGERLWTFDSRHKKALERLESDGFVLVASGIVENSVRASLTRVALRRYIEDSTFVPEGFRAYAETIADYMDEIGVESNVGRIIRKQFGRN